MPFDRPGRGPDQPDQHDQPERRPDRARSEVLDDNGLNAAEYIREWNRKVESGEAERDQAAEERPRRDVDMRDSNGMTAAELRFLRNKRIDEAEAKASEASEGEAAPPRNSVMTDAKGRTGAEIRFQEAKRAEEAAKAKAAVEAPETPPQDGDARPEVKREFRTVTEELGESKSWHSFSAAKREIRARLGHESGVEVDHIVEQCQSDPRRSGFAIEKINSSDNMTRLDKSVHQEKTSEFASNVPGFGVRLRDMLNGAPWEEHYERGCEILNEKLKERRERDND